MQEHTTPSPASRRSGGRIVSIVAGGIAALLAIGLIAAGALLLWADSEKDDQGYLSTGKDRYAASTYALASDDLGTANVTAAATARRCRPIRTSGPPRPTARARRPSNGMSRTVTGRSSS